MLELGAPPLTPAERIERAKQLTAAHLWDEAVAELALVPTTARRRSRASATTGSAPRCSRCGGATAMPAKLLLGVYPKHGRHRRRGDVPRRARAVACRQGRRRDRLVPQGRRRVSAHGVRPGGAVPRRAGSSSIAARYKEAIAPLEESLAKYPTIEVGRRRAVVPRHVALLPRRVGRRRASSSTRSRSAAARSRAARAATGSRASTSGSATTRRAIAGYRETITQLSVLVVRAARARAARRSSASKLGPFGDRRRRRRSGPKLAADRRRGARERRR